MKVREFIERVKKTFSSRQESRGDQCIQFGHVTGDIVIKQTTHVAPCTDAMLRREQARVLRCLNQLDGRARAGVIEFMRREFNTGLVKSLDWRSLRRVEAYIGVVRKNATYNEAGTT